MNSLCDRAIDTPKTSLDSQAVRVHLLLPNRLQSILNRIEHWQTSLPWSSSKQSCISRVLKYFPISFLFECLILIYQLSTNRCHGLANNKLVQFHLILEIISILLIVTDVIQLIYWFYYSQQRICSIWINLFAFSIICRLTSSIIHLIILIHRPSAGLCTTFYTLKSLSLIQGIFFGLFLLEPLRLFLNYILHRYIRDSYDIGLAYISSEEHILKIVHRLTDHGTRYSPRRSSIDSVRFRNYPYSYS